MSDYDLDAIVAQHREATGGDELTFTFGGEKFTMPHPLLADDEWKDELAEITSDVEMGLFVLGEDQYERFRELGGRASFIGLLMRKAQEDFVDQDRQGRPTRRSTSSPVPKRRPKRR
jgi:hypothetical protein